MKNVRLKSPKMSTNQTDSEVEKQINPIDVSEAEELREPSVQNKTQDSDVLDLDDIRLDPVKSRRGRPKGTKIHSGTFLKRQMWQTKRGRQQRKSKIKVKSKILKVTIIQMLIKLLKMNKKQFWVKVNKHTLTQKDKTDIKTKQLLNDKVIDTAQEIMKSQFIDPKIYGFQSVLNKQRESFQKVENGMIQILHRGPITQDIGLPFPL